LFIGWHGKIHNDERGRSAEIISPVRETSQFRLIFSGGLKRRENGALNMASPRSGSATFGTESASHQGRHSRHNIQSPTNGAELVSPGCGC
jgi:hypothetical protein